jgi:hypothetical protein
MISWVVTRGEEESRSPITGLRPATSRSSASAPAETLILGLPAVFAGEWSSGRFQPDAGQ